MRVGVDVGGTKTDAVAINDSGEILHRLRVSTGFGAGPVLETTAGVVSARCVCRSRASNRWGSGYLAPSTA
jgi:predicted NBD/HSP70 family sugar kinase